MMFTRVTRLALATICAVAAMTTVVVAPSSAASPFIIRASIANPTIGETVTLTVTGAPPNSKIRVAITSGPDKDYFYAITTTSPVGVAYAKLKGHGIGVDQVVAWVDTNGNGKFDPDIDVPAAGVAVPWVSGCPDYQFIGVRGSGEQQKDAKGYGNTVGDIKDKLLALNPTSKIPTTAVDYQAIPVAAIDPTYRFRYEHSIDTGVDALNKVIATFMKSRCAAYSKLLMAGYSQGAEVLGNVYQDLEPEVAAKVARIALIADPLFKGSTGAPIAVGSYDPSQNGVWPTLKALERGGPRSWTTSDEAKVRSYCTLRDPVCSTNPVDAPGCIMLESCVHKHYADIVFGKRTYTEHAARFLAGLTADAPVPPTPPTPTGPSGGAAGDPHLRTFDQMLYDIQAEGEFRFAESIDDAFAVQVRFKFGSSTVSYADEYAVRTPQGQVIVYDGSGYTVDGVRGGADPTALAGGGVVSASGVQLGDGTSITWGALPRARSVQVVLAQARAGRMRGLLGDGNGNPNNDGTSVDGRPLITPGSLEGLDARQIEELLYDDYAAGWVVKANRLFSGPERPFVKPARPKVFSDFTAEEIEAATSLCKAAGRVEPELSLCVYDVLVTGDSRFADPSFGVGAGAGAVSSGGEPDLNRDTDGDGFSADDCNDVDATIFPGAPEVRGDGIDQDCDGADRAAAFAQEIDFNLPAKAGVGEPSESLVGQASSGLPVTYTASGPCTLTGGQVSFDGLGTCTVTASQAGDDDYLPATSVSRTIEIGKGQPWMTLTATRLTDMYATARLTNGRGQPLVLRTVTITAGDGKPATPRVTLCVATTGLDGTATCRVDPTQYPRAILSTITATFAGTDTYKAVSAVARPRLF